MTRVLLSLSTLMLLTFPAAAQQAVAPDAGCAQVKGSYHCNWSSFKLSFERAHTLGVESRPMDRSTTAQLNTMIAELGKSPAGEGQGADLSLLLLPADPTGLNSGPGDHELATLRVYAPGDGSAHGTLLWVETLRGQGDRPWPAQVHALLTQFQERFGKGSGR